MASWADFSLAESTSTALVCLGAAARILPRSSACDVLSVRLTLMLPYVSVSLLG